MPNYHYIIKQERGVLAWLLEEKEELAELMPILMLMIMLEKELLKEKKELRSQLRKRKN